MKKEYSTKEIESIVHRFEDRTLPETEWTHEAHLAVAIWYCIVYKEGDIQSLLKQNISLYNLAAGKMNSDTQGYHETITRFWLWNAATFIKAGNYIDPEIALNALLASECGSRDYPLKYYSRSLLFSVEARHRFVDADLLSMPALKGIIV